MRENVVDTARYAHLLRESKASGASPIRMDSALRSKVNRAMAKDSRLGGNTKVNRPWNGAEHAETILKKHGLQLDTEPTPSLFHGSDGRRLFPIANKEGKRLENSMLVLTWHRMEQSRMYEVIAYVS